MWRSHLANACALRRLRWLRVHQLQRGQMSLNPVPTDCVALIDSCVLTLQGVASVPIVSHIAASLPATLNLDPLRVSQVGAWHGAACRKFAVAGHSHGCV